MREQEQRIKIAIQKSGGRLFDDSMNLLNSCGLNFEFKGRQLMTSVTNFPLDILLLRDDDIPTFVEVGDIELGIVGENLVLEYQPMVEVIRRLGFGKCKLTVGIPFDSELQQIDQFSGLLLASTYPNITRRFFAESGIEIDIVKQNGSLEIAPYVKRGVTGITEIVESSRTMEENGIRPLLTIQEFEAVLIANPNSYQQRGSRRIIDQLLFRIDNYLR